MSQKYMGLWVLVILVVLGLFRLSTINPKFSSDPDGIKANLSESQVGAQEDCKVEVDYENSLSVLKKNIKNDISQIETLQKPATPEAKLPSVFTAGTETKLKEITDALISKKAEIENLVGDELKEKVTELETDTKNLEDKIAQIEADLKNTEGNNSKKQKKDELEKYNNKLKVDIASLKGLKKPDCKIIKTPVISTEYASKQEFSNLIERVAQLEVSTNNISGIATELAEVKAALLKKADKGGESWFLPVIIMLTFLMTWTAIAFTYFRPVRPRQYTMPFDHAAAKQENDPRILLKAKDLEQKYKDMVKNMSDRISSLERDLENLRKTQPRLNTSSIEFDKHNREDQFRREQAVKDRNSSTRSEFADTDSQQPSNREALLENRGAPARLTVHYAPAPDNSNCFDAKDFSQRSTRDVLYKISLKTNSTSAEFELIDQSDTVNTVLRYPDTMLFRACDCENGFNSNATRIITIEKGEITKQGDKWRINKKAKIRFEA